MRGSVADAYTWIAQIGAQQWADDLQRALTLWQRIEATDGFLIEDSHVAWLRPVSSVSQEVDRLIMRQACSWLGVDMDGNCRRARGRPQRAGEEGDFIFVEVNASNEVTGRLKKDFAGIRAGTDLADVGLMRLIELLGALRTQKLEVDAEYLEAYLDAAAPDWREQGASYAAGDGDGAGMTPDPYEVLGVPRDAPMEISSRPTGASCSGFIPISPMSATGLPVWPQLPIALFAMNEGKLRDRPERFPEAAGPSRQGRWHWQEKQGAGTHPGRDAGRADGLRRADLVAAAITPPQRPRLMCIRMARLSRPAMAYRATNR